MAKDGTRRELADIVVQRKEQLWGQGDRPFNPQRSARNVLDPPSTDNPPSLALLRWAANASDDNLLIAAGSKDPDYSFLYYK